MGHAVDTSTIARNVLAMGRGKPKRSRWRYCEFRTIIVARRSRQQQRQLYPAVDVGGIVWSPLPFVPCGWRFAIVVVGSVGRPFVVAPMLL